MLILDFDGTIADTRLSIVATIQDTLKELGLNTVKEEEIEKRIGLPLKDTFVEVAGLEGELVDKAIKIYRSKYNEICLNTVKLFPNVKETLKKLHERGVIITVASSKGKDALNKLLKNLEISQYISLIFGEQDVVNKKPAPDMALLILKKTNSKAEDTLVVGDTIFDIGMGKAAGCKTCGVTYGNNTIEQLKEKEPDYIVDDFSKILDIVK